MTINEMMNNPELLADIAEDLEDFDADSEVCYEVWAIGYDENDEVVDAELCMFTSTDRDEAINYAKNVTLADIIYEAGNGPCDCNTAKIKIEVETVVPVTDDLMNVGTVFEKEVWSFDEPAEFVEEEPIKPIYTAFPWVSELLEDKSLNVKCSYLRDYSVGDIAHIAFLEGPMAIEGELYNIYNYKVVSKETGEDGEYYHCELIDRVCTK